jgi:hypothetical protein
MDKVQKVDRNNTTPTSKTFRDEFHVLCSPVWPAKEQDGFRIKGNVNIKMHTVFIPSYI